MTWAKESGSLIQRRRVEMTSTRNSTLLGEEGGEESELVAWRAVLPPLPLPLPRPLPRPRPRTRPPREAAPELGTSAIATQRLGAMERRCRRKKERRRRVHDEIILIRR